MSVSATIFGFLSFMVMVSLFMSLFGNFNIRNLERVIGLLINWRVTLSCFDTLTKGLAQSLRRASTKCWTAAVGRKAHGNVIKQQWHLQLSTGAELLLQ